MKTDIVNFCRQVCKAYGLQAYFQPKHEVYIVHYRGKNLQNFTAKQFYEVPTEERKRMIRALLKVGLYNNLDNKGIQDLHTSFKKGLTIVP